MIFPPAKYAITVTLEHQLKKIIEECCEALSEVKQGNDDAAINVELYDVLHACETLQRKVEFELSATQRLDAIEQVVAKNKARGYYDE